MDDNFSLRRRRRRSHNVRIIVFTLLYTAIIFEGHSL